MKKVMSLKKRGEGFEGGKRREKCNKMLKREKQRRDTQTGRHGSLGFSSVVIDH